MHQQIVLFLRGLGGGGAQQAGQALEPIQHSVGGLVGEQRQTLQQAPPQMRVGQIVELGAVLVVVQAEVGQGGHLETRKSLKCGIHIGAGRLMSTAYLHSRNYPALSQ